MKTEIRLKLIIDQLIDQTCNSVARAATCRQSGNVILEALLAHMTDDAVVDALNAQHLAGDAYREDAKLLIAIANQRRDERKLPLVDPIIADACIDLPRVIVNTLRQLETATAGEMCDALCGCDIEHQYVFQWLSHESVKPDGQVVALRIVKNGTSMNQYSVRA